MITSSITVQCCPLHIIHNVTYTMGEIHSYPRRPQSRNSVGVELKIYATLRREIALADNVRVAQIISATCFALLFKKKKKLIISDA